MYTVLIFLEVVGQYDFLKLLHTLILTYKTAV